MTAPIRQALIAMACLPLLASAQNRLAHSQSPYLLQHADNPVDWYPWGEEAFAKAQQENKLVFVSIGYSTCHWCHVMNRESFSDPEIAAYLNDHYVAIKIDREERPDVDSVYMNFVYNLRGSAGWPLNVWLTPELQPVYGGTYYPPRDHPQKGPGFLPLLQNLQHRWEDDPEQLRQRSASFVASLNAAHAPDPADERPLDFGPLATAITSYFFEYDADHHGFGDGEKFPSPTAISFLLRAANTPELHREDRDLARSMAIDTLDAIIRSGLRDHLGGGFHRYSVDPQWQLPHFEKMLYDQALMATALVDAWQLTGDSDYQDAATETLDYLLTELRHPDHAFLSAEDAESVAPEDPNRKREGAFYLWTAEQFAARFPQPEKQAFLKAYFAISEAGNAPAGDFPTEPFRGFNALRIETDLARLAAAFAIDENVAKQWVRDAKSTLREARSKRPRPYKDDKVIVSWNGLAISALARAAQAFQRPDYAEAAARAAAFLKRRCYDPSAGSLARLYRENASPVDGFAEDYAYLVQGLLDLYEATADHQWIVWANQLQQKQIDLFYDRENGGFFLFPQSENSVFDRSKRQSDSALPSPNAVSIPNLSRLSQLLDRPDYQERARQTARAFLPQLETAPTALPTHLASLAYVVNKPLQIVLAGDPQAEDLQQLLAVANRRLLPNRCLVYADQADGQRFLAERLAFLQDLQPLQGKATAYVCENYACQLPTSDADQLAGQLDRKTASPLAERD